MNNIKVTCLSFLFISICFCIACHPQYVKLNDSGYKKTQTEDYDGALKDFEKSLAVNDSYWLAYSNRGASYAFKGDSAKAMADFNKSISLRKENSFAYDNRGLMKQSQGDTKGALADFREALKYGRHNNIVYTHLGRLLAESDSCTEALKYLNIAIKKNAFNDCNTKEELVQLKNKCER